MSAELSQRIVISGSPLRLPTPVRLVLDLTRTPKLMLQLHKTTTNEISSSLANHGYLPRGGRNISVPMILDAALGKQIPHSDKLP
jgi:hypothetical protein